MSSPYLILAHCIGISLNRICLHFLVTGKSQTFVSYVQCPTSHNPLGTKTIYRNACVQEAVQNGYFFLALYRLLIWSTSAFAARNMVLNLFLCHV